MQCCSEWKTALVQPFCSAHCSANKSLKQRCFNVFCIVRGVLSIEQKFRFEILEIPRAQWKSTFRLHRPDPSLCYDFFVKLSCWCFFFIVVVPNAPPDNVRGNNETSTSIFVQWDEVPADNQNGNIVNYTVTYTKLPSGSLLVEVVIAPKRNITLVQLNKFTNYSITVFASTSKGGGSRSDPIFVITDEDSEYNSGVH